MARSSGPGDGILPRADGLPALASYTAAVPRAPTPRTHPRQWRQILTDALARQDAVSVRGTVVDHLRRTPTRAEISTARRAAHGLAASGQATILRITPPGFDGPGSRHLILARPGATMRSGLLGEIAEI